MSDSPRQLNNAKVSVMRLNSTGPIEALAVVSLDSTGGIGTPGAGSTQVSIREILTLGGTSAMDSTANALRVNVVAGSAAGDTTMTVSTGSVRVHQSTAADLNANVVQGSTVWAVQVSSVAGAVTVSLISSSGVSMSTDAAPASTKQGVIVRQVGNTYDSSGALQVNTGPGGSTQVAVSSGIVQVQPISSSGVSMSTDTDPASTKQGLIVRQVGYSTTINVSSLAGKVTVDQNSTVWPVQIPSSQSIQVKNSTIGDLLASVQQNSTVWAVQVDGRVRAQNSTIGDLLASVQQNSTVWQTQAAIRDSSGTLFTGSTTRPSTGAQGLVVRPVLNDLQSTAFSTIGNGSTSSTIVSSAAAIRHKVFAYSITSTVQAVNTLTFASSLGNPLWHIQLQSISSGISGANLAVSPPAWLFATEAASPLVFKVTGTTGTYHLSFSYFSEA